MVDILKLSWVKILNFKFSGDADVLLVILKFDQDLCLNLQYDFGKIYSTLGSIVPLAMFDDTGTAEGIDAFIYRTKWRSGQVLLMPYGLTHNFER